MIPHGATQDMSIIDLPGLRDKLRTLDAEGKAENQTEKPHWELMPERISVMEKWFLMDGVRTRVELGGHGPQEIALAGEFAFIPLFFSDCVAVVNVAEKRKVAEIPPSPPKNDSRTLHLDAQRLGQRIFHDAGKSYQKRDACAVCHPDGRSDGVNWDLMHDGLGNPKNTKSLLYARQTPPATWTGIRTDAKACAFGMFKHVHFHLATEEEVALVVAYMDSLEPLPSPRLADGGLSEKARRGQEVFQRVKCGECHVPETFFTDGKMHDVGTENPYDRRADFDTPTLREVWRTAPYLHDGSAPDIYHLLKEKRHGLPQMEGEGLTDEELRALAEYVLTL